MISSLNTKSEADALGASAEEEVIYSETLTLQYHLLSLIKREFTIVIFTL